MEPFSSMIQRNLICLAIACLVIGAATSAHAVPQKQLLTTTINQIFTGTCCFPWNAVVFVNEPAKLTPVTVRWSADFEQNTLDNFTIGLMINGGPCRVDIGPTALGNFAVDFR